MSVLFVTKFKNYKCQHETISQESIVDPSGYISPKRRIENLIRAGERLYQYRREMYDYGEDSEDDGEWLDPMREPGLDLADIHTIRESVRARLSNSKPAIDLNPTAESEKAIEEEPQIEKQEVKDGEK